MRDHILIEVKNLRKTFPVKSGFGKKYIEAVNDVSFSMGAGETLAVIGESGSGKTTVGRMILKLAQPTAGAVLYRGEDITNFRGRKLKAYRKAVQAVFQDPYSSLNPRMRVIDIVAEPLRNFGYGGSLRDRAAGLLEDVGLDSGFLTCYPHHCSGGQKQRIAMARALAAEPAAIVLDEPLSALDITVQNQVIGLLNELKARYGLSYLLITHDLRVVRAIADRVIVMYRGNIIETAEKEEFFTHPAHPYSRSLLTAVPCIDGEISGIADEVAAASLEI